MKLIAIYCVFVVLALTANVLMTRSVSAATPPGRFWVSDLAVASDGRTAYLLHDRVTPRFCMLVLETTTGTVWTPRNCE